jgi:hypothetical protein
MNKRIFTINIKLMTTVRMTRIHNRLPMYLGRRKKEGADDEWYTAYTKRTERSLRVVS